MLHLFVSPAPIEGWGDYPYDGTTLSQLLAMLIVVVSVGSLALTVCLSLVVMLAGGGPPGAGRVSPGLSWRPNASVAIGDLAT
jgi:hypothetical protein